MEHSEGRREMPGEGEGGYISKEGHKQGTKLLGKVRAINDVGK